MKEVVSPVNVDARRTLGIRPGDTVRVKQKIQEKGKTRLQAFEGLVLTVKHGTEPGSTFTVRKVASGVGVEKTFPLFSPLIDSIEIIKRTKVRRAKLYHIREKAAKEIRRAMRNAFMVTGASVSESADAAAAEARAEEEAKAAEEVAKAEAEANTEEAVEKTETPAEEAKEETPADTTAEDKKD